MISDVTITGAVQDSQKTQGQSAKLAGDFNQFLILLTTQLQNQDPLNPMDSSEFTSQLVQFSQVEQAINQNQKLDDLVSLQLGSASSVALGYVGLDINYISSDMNFTGKDPLTISYALEKDAREANINVFNDKGDLVFTANAPNNTGSHEFVWNGERSDGSTAEPGTYSVSIDALDSEGKAIDTSTVVSGHVRGIESQNGVVFLLIGDRAVPLGQVINATLPEKKAPIETPAPATAQAQNQGGIV